MSSVRHEMFRAMRDSLLQLKQVYMDSRERRGLAVADLDSIMVDMGQQLRTLSPELCPPFSIL